MSEVKSVTILRYFLPSYTGTVFVLFNLNNKLHMEKVDEVEIRSKNYVTVFSLFHPYWIGDEYLIVLLVLKKTSKQQ